MRAYSSSDRCSFSSFQKLWPLSTYYIHKQIKKSFLERYQYVIIHCDCTVYFLVNMLLHVCMSFMNRVFWCWNTISMLNRLVRLRLWMISIKVLQMLASAIRIMQHMLTKKMATLATSATAFLTEKQRTRTWKWFEIWTVFSAGYIHVHVYITCQRLADASVSSLRPDAGNLWNDVRPPSWGPRSRAQERLSSGRVSPSLPWMHSNLDTILTNNACTQRLTVLFPWFHTIVCIKKKTCRRQREVVGRAIGATSAITDAD